MPLAFCEGHSLTPRSRVRRRSTIDAKLQPAGAPAGAQRTPIMILRPLARNLASSWLFRRARSLWQRNQHDVLMPLSRLDKLLVGTYLILRDLGEGRFPP